MTTQPVSRLTTTTVAVLVALLWLTLDAAPLHAQTQDNSVILEARDAFRKQDASRLERAKTQAIASNHPLSVWADYWDLTSRISELTTEQAEAFYVRWKGFYLEDRFRNDWLLELGRRSEWEAFARDQPRFRMNDDREVTCYSLLAQHQSGRAVYEPAMAAWLAQTDADTACLRMASTLLKDQTFSDADVWRKARVASLALRPKAAHQALSLLGTVESRSFKALIDSPARYLSRKASSFNRLQAELTTLALMRMATNDPLEAADLLRNRWQSKLPKDLAAWAWAMVGKQAAILLLPQAHEIFQRVDQTARSTNLTGKTSPIELGLPGDLWAWQVRAALRAPQGPQWRQIQSAIEHMNTEQQRDPTWVYWKARSLHALSDTPTQPLADNVVSAELLQSISSGYHFYGQLAAQDLGLPIALPSPPEPLSDSERSQAAGNPGLSRALQLIGLGLRGEGDREWNFSLRGMNERQLLAAAQRACDLEVWKNCINTSDRTQKEIDLTQRFPMPFRSEVTTKAQAAGIDPAFVYGLIRQESRFILDARSGVGASGLMQLMPATARWTAKRIGLPYSNTNITDRDTNLKLGTTYLKLVLDDLEGSQPMATAAYNAGPGRPRRWREGPQMEPAAWAESIPFTETRDYVKKVLSNATYYDFLLGNPAPSLKARLGRPIGPRSASAASTDPDLP